ncbi:MAG: hypothetical protein AB1567_07365, partial [bacterium]
QYHKIKEAIKQLEELEYLIIEQKAKGLSYTYRLNLDEEERTLIKGLTTPQELEKRLRRRGRT